jgi:transcriptional regulator with XRE-family HTH domain
VARKKFDSIDAYLAGTNSTQQQLADELGITQSALSMIKNGLRIPRPELALRLHEVTGIPLTTLLSRREQAAS